MALAGCELIAEFDRSKIDGGGVDSSFPDAPTQDVKQDAPIPDAGVDAADAGSDAADAGSDAADAGSDAADAGSDAADAGSDAAGDASDAGAADADAGTASLTIAPTTIDYANVTSGNSSVDVTFTVTNTGTATSGVPSAPVLGGTDSGQFGVGTNTCSSALAPAATCTVLVHFSPTSAGVKSANVSVTASPGGTAQASLAGTGVASTNFSISPTSHAYGDQAINNPSADQTYTVTNNGGSASGTLSAPVFAGDGNQFMITTDNCAGQILAAAGGTCTVLVHFHPTSTGQKAASMTVSDGTDSATASLGGNGI